MRLLNLFNAKIKTFRGQFRGVANIPFFILGRKKYLHEKVSTGFYD